ncbi:SCO6745 family protein [Saccharopolyspora sp. MS10]|uniref:SCO6745 family protein n=1 Tax=Saccharopolyspora sp. MS10 TaxID=3385973 RepID=UPI0039A12146
MTAQPTPPTGTELARPGHRSVEALHSMIYFSPDADEAFTALGLDTRPMRYFAGRAAPMGAVGAGIVAATFYNFNPRIIAEVIPRAWSIAAPATVVETRFRAADASLRRLLGPEALGSDELAEAAALARRATDACRPEARPLFAGHADLDWPEAPHLVLWHAASLLREHRGDGHLMVLQEAGLTGAQALVLQITSGEGLSRKFAQLSRGWSDQEWQQAQDELRQRGLLDDAGEITAAGREFREDVEHRTDALAAAPWAHLGAENAQRLAGHGKQLSRLIAKAGAFPGQAFAGGGRANEG